MKGWVWKFSLVPGLAHLLLLSPIRALMFFVVVIVGWLLFAPLGFFLHVACCADAQDLEKSWRRS